MMKCITQMLVAIILALFCVILLAACEATKITYPYIQYRKSSSDFDIKNRIILLDEGYYLDDGHPYDMVETESGYDLVLHFTKG